MLPAGWLILRGGSDWNVWKGYGEHWAASRFWVWLTAIALLLAAVVAGYSLLQVMPGLSADSTVDYFWAKAARNCGNSVWMRLTTSITLAPG